jgi:AcrR family transcriptional regulator
VASGLRERKKSETRRALIDAAIDLFAEHGFEQTTVDEVAAAVGVSARTFHRYFPRKEDVILADSAERLVHFRDRLAHHVGAPSPLESVRLVVAEAAVAHDGVDRDEQSRERMRVRAQVASATPALHAHNVAMHEDWVAVVAEHAARMVAEEPTDRWPSLFGACTMAAVATAIQRWWSNPSSDLADEYEAVLDILRGIDRPSVLDATGPG